MICQRCDWILDPYLESVNMPHKSDRYTRCRLSLLAKHGSRDFHRSRAHTPFLEWRVLDGVLHLIFNKSVSTGLVHVIF